MRIRREGVCRGSVIENMHIFSCCPISCRGGEEAKIERDTVNKK